MTSADHPRLLWTGLLLLAGLVGLSFYLPSGQPSGQPEPETETPVHTVECVESSQLRLPPEVSRRYPPGSRIPVRVPYVGKGIEVGPGQFLPPLNDVKVEDGIPPIRRDPRLPPPGPVVAKVVGPDGQQYWEHEDGSLTSCTYSRIQTADGRSKQIVATQHGALAKDQRRATR